MSVPAGYGTVTPWLISRDTVRLIEFTRDAFGAEELGRVPGPDGGIGHAEVRIGDSVVLMFDAREGWPDTPGFLRLYVPDADAVYERALAAGATSVTPVTALFFGDRVGRIRDPQGHIWWIQAHVEDVDPAELARRPQDPAAAAALRLLETSLDAVLLGNRTLFPAFSARALEARVVRLWRGARRSRPPPRFFAGRRRARTPPSGPAGPGDAPTERDEGRPDRLRVLSDWPMFAAVLRLVDGFVRAMA